MAQRKVTINKKRQRLENILERLKSNDEVSLRDFKNALSEEGLRDYEHALEQRRSFLANPIAGSADYDRLLKKGILFANRGEAARKKDIRLCRKYLNRAEACFGEALERLEEDIGQNPGIASAYDRPIDQVIVSSDPSGLPRLRNSKSADNELRETPKLDKRKLKIQIVEEALARERKVEGVLENRLSGSTAGSDPKEGRKMVLKVRNRAKGTGSSGAGRKLVQSSSDAMGAKLAQLRKKLLKSKKSI